MALRLHRRCSRLKFGLMLGAGLVVGTALAGATRTETAVIAATQPAP